MKRVNKNDIINQVSEDAYLSKADAKAAVEAVFDIIGNVLKEGGEVNVANFATFVAVNRKERIGTDPSSHQQIKIKARKGVAIRMSKELKAKLNGE